MIYRKRLLFNYFGCWKYFIDCDLITIIIRSEIIRWSIKPSQLQSFLEPSNEPNRETCFSLLRLQRWEDMILGWLTALTSYRIQPKKEQRPRSCREKMKEVQWECLNPWIQLCLKSMQSWNPQLYKSLDPPFCLN